MRINFVIEGDADLEMARKLINAAGHTPGRHVIKSGSGNLDRDIHKYVIAAQYSPWVVIRDADEKCPVKLVTSLLGSDSRPPNFQLRIAQSMAEAWLLADIDSFSDFFKIQRKVIPEEPDSLPNAKRTLLRLCKRSRSSQVSSAMVRADGNVGTGYVELVNTFARERWSVGDASKRSPSLARAVLRIRQM